MASDPIAPSVKRVREKPPRPKGEGGSWHWREDRKSWQVEIELSRVGKKRKRRVVYGKTKAEVKRKIQDLTARGGGTVQPADLTRVWQFMDRWLARAQTRRKPKTAESYAWAWSVAKPYIGNIRFDEFDRKDVNRLYQDLQRDGASANTVRHVARVMHTAFASAMAESAYKGDDGGNPFKHAAPNKPDHRVERGRALSVEEALRFLEAARADELEAAWVLGLTAGLRIGEMFGLKWSDVDLIKRTIFVQRQAQFVVADTDAVDDDGNPVREGKLLILDLKTEDSLRLLPLGELAVSALRHRKTAARKIKSEWIFPSTNPGMPISPNNARRRNFAETVKRAKIEGRFTPHDLRHTMNSIGGAAGVTEKVRSERMGHADSAITRRVYTHTIDGQARDAAQKIDSFLQQMPQKK